MCTRIQLSLIPPKSHHADFHFPGETVQGRIYLRGLRLNILYTVIVRHVSLTEIAPRGRENEETKALTEKATSERPFFAQLMCVTSEQWRRMPKEAKSSIKMHRIDETNFDGSCEALHDFSLKLCHECPDTFSFANRFHEAGKPGAGDRESFCKNFIEVKCFSAEFGFQKNLFPIVVQKVCLPQHLTRSTSVPRRLRRLMPATNHEDGERFQTMNIHVRLDSTSSQKRSDSNSGPFNCLPKAGRASGKIEDSYKTLDRLRVTFTLPRSVRAGEEVRSKLRMDNWRDFDAFSVFVDVECRAKIFLEGQEDGSKENLAYFQRHEIGRSDGRGNFLPFEAQNFRKSNEIRSPRGRGKDHKGCDNKDSAGGGTTPCQNEIQRPLRQQRPPEECDDSDNCGEENKTEMEGKLEQRSLVLEPEFPLGAPHPLTGYQNYVEKVVDDNRGKIPPGITCSTRVNLVVSMTSSDSGERVEHELEQAKILERGPREKMVCSMGLVVLPQILKVFPPSPSAYAEPEGNVGEKQRALEQRAQNGTLLFSGNQLQQLEQRLTPEGQIKQEPLGSNAESNKMTGGKFPEQANGSEHASNLMTNNASRLMDSDGERAEVDAQYLSFDADLEERRSSKLLSNALVLTPMNSPHRKSAQENGKPAKPNNLDQFRGRPGDKKENDDGAKHATVSSAPKERSAHRRPAKINISLADLRGAAGDDREFLVNDAGIVIRDSEGRSKQFRNVFLGLLKMRYAAGDASVVNYQKKAREKSALKQQQRSRSLSSKKSQGSVKNCAGKEVVSSSDGEEEGSLYSSDSYSTRRNTSLKRRIVRKKRSASKSIENFRRSTTTSARSSSDIERLQSGEMSLCSDLEEATFRDEEAEGRWNEVGRPDRRDSGPNTNIVGASRQPLSIERRKTGGHKPRISSKSSDSLMVPRSRNNSLLESLGSDSRISTPTSSKMDDGDGDGETTPKSDILEHDKKLFQQSLPGSVLNLQTN